MEKLISKASEMTNEQLTEAISIIAAKPALTTELRMVRAALIEVYIQRTSAEAGDKLMDALGM